MWDEGHMVTVTGRNKDRRGEGRVHRSGCLTVMLLLVVVVMMIC